MIGLLMLMTVAVGAAAMYLTGNEEAYAAGSDTDGTNGPDLVADSAYENEINRDLDFLVSDEEITQAEADAIRDRIDYRDGAINTDTGDGEDVVYGSELDDTITTGSDEDLVLAGEGGDTVDLGAGEDTYGIDSHWRQSLFDDHYVYPLDYAPVGDEAQQEYGDDTIFGGEGDDSIADGYGVNMLDGGQGDDFLIAVDEDVISPDTVFGGAGRDEIVVDEGDTVTTGAGGDYVLVELQGQVGESYQPVEVTDYLLGVDRLEVSLWEDAEDPLVAVEDSTDGTAAILSVDGIPIARIVGGQGLTVSDLRITRQ